MNYVVFCLAAVITSLTAVALLPPVTPIPSLEPLPLRNSNTTSVTVQS